MNLLYLSSPGGGLDTNVRVLAPALVKAGHSVSVLYVHFPGDQIPATSDQVGGYLIYHATMGNWHYYARRATFGLTGLPSMVRAVDHARALRQSVAIIHKRQGLDLVELPEGFVTPAMTKNIPYVMRLHSSAWMCRRMYREVSPVSDSFEAWLEGVALRRATAISSPSRMVADYIAKTCNPQKPIDIIPLPVDTVQFHPAKCNSNESLVLFVGRVEKRKGADVLMQAIPLVLARHPDCRFVFVGGVSDEVKDQVSTMPSSVQFLGLRPHEELVSWYQRASVFVAPSLWDNSPNTIYEAMACGTPVVASRVGGIPELVEVGRTGLLVNPGDAEALADAIVSLLGDGDRCAQMGKCARERAVAQYSLDKILAQTLAFYEHALNASNVLLGYP